MSETLAAQLKKTALAAKTAAENIDIKQKKADIVKDCAASAGFGETSCWFTFHRLDIPKSDRATAYAELKDLLEQDGFVVTKGSLGDFTVSWE
jgi:hypothetical protein